MEPRGRPTKGSKTATADAALVNVLDFERALGKLPDQLQLLLVFRYRDGQNQKQVAEALGVSVRTVSTLEGLAVSKLAESLDRTDSL
jgi:RNA polymerase sigma factor (sigma-70 family)